MTETHGIPEGTVLCRPKRIKRSLVIRKPTGPKCEVDGVGSPSDMNEKQPEVRTQKGAGEETAFESPHLLSRFFTSEIPPRITFCAGDARLFITYDDTLT